MTRPHPYRAPADVTVWARTYRPQLAGPDRAALVVGLVLAAEPTGRADARALASAVSGLVFWAAENAVPLAPDALLDRRTVDRYLATGLPGMSGQTLLHYRARLDRTAEAALPAAPPARPGRGWGRAPAAGYSLAEQGRLLGWAMGQAAPHRQAAMTAAVVLGLGAGLTGDEVLACRGTDLTVLPDGTAEVRVRGPRPRTTVLLAGWQALAADAARAAGPGRVIPPGPRRADGAPLPAELAVAVQVYGGSPDPTVPGLVGHRLRNTWLLGHLEAGTRLDVLARAAGLDPVTLLKKHVKAMRPQPPADATAALRRADLPDRAVAPPPPRPDRPLHGMSPGAARLIAGYRGERDVYRHVETIRALATAAGPVSAASARHAVSAAGCLVRWADRHGRPTRPHDLAARAFVDAWAAAPDGALGLSGTTRQARLVSAEKIVAGIRPDQALPSATDETPYTPEDTGRLLRWARAQTDPNARRLLLAVLGLGLGAGLTVGEHQHVAGGDVVQDPTTGTVLVRLSGPRARTVPCLARWENVLWRAALDAGTGLLLPPGTLPSRAEGHGLVGQIPRTGGVPALTARRCRRTWLASHLASGTRVDTLLRAAGLGAGAHLAAEAQALLPPPDEEARQWLRRNPDRSRPSGPYGPPGSTP